MFFREAAAVSWAESVEMLRAEYGAAAEADLAATLERLGTPPAMTSLRVNTAHGDRAALIAELNAVGVPAMSDHPLSVLAVDGTIILLHPPLPLVGVSIVMERERPQNDSLVYGYCTTRCPSRPHTTQAHIARSISTQHTQHDMAHTHTHTQQAHSTHTSTSMAHTPSQHIDTANRRQRPLCALLACALVCGWRVPSHAVLHG